MQGAGEIHLSRLPDQGNTKVMLPATVGQALSPPTHTHTQGRKGAKISQELFASGLLALAFLDFVIFENSLGIDGGLQTQDLALFLHIEMIYRLRISIIQLRRNAKLLWIYQEGSSWNEDAIVFRNQNWDKQVGREITLNGIVRFVKKSTMLKKTVR